jgi:hypothetical protein
MRTAKMEAETLYTTRSQCQGAEPALTLVQAAQEVVILLQSNTATLLRLSWWMME